MTCKIYEDLSNVITSCDYENMINSVGMEKTFQVLALIVKTIHDHPFRKDIPIKTLEDFFCTWMGMPDIDLVVLQICGKIYIPNSHLRWLIKTFEVCFSHALHALIDAIKELEKNPLSGYLHNISIPRISCFSVMCNRFLQCTDENPDQLDWFELKRIFEETLCMKEINEYFCAKISQHSGTAPYPEWCISKVFEDLPEEFSENILTEDEFMEKRDSILPKLKLDEDKAQDIERLISYSLLFEPYPEEDERNKIDHILGLANPILNEKCVSFNGKCRMLSCLCHEGYEMNDWFEEKTCDKCSITIAQKSQVLRYPRSDGGFQFRFCCFDHMIEFLREQDAKKFYEEYMKNPDYSSPEFQDNYNRCLVFYNVLNRVKIWTNPIIIK